MLSEDALYSSAYVPARLEQDEVADQDWMEMAWLLRYQCPDLFIETVLVLRATLYFVFVMYLDVWLASPTLFEMMGLLK